MNIEQAKECLKSIVDFYKLNDETNYDYSDDVLISMKLVLEEIDRLNHSLEQANKEIKNLEKHRDLMIKHYDEEVEEYYDIINKAIDYVEHISNVDIDWHEQDRIINILRKCDNE